MTKLNGIGALLVSIGGSFQAMESEAGRLIGVVLVAIGALIMDLKTMNLGKK